MRNTRRLTRLVSARESLQGEATARGRGNHWHLFEGR
jgi:hypothetical protein